MSVPSDPSAAERKVTAAQRAANRANGKKSHGPVSQTGKAAVSQNAVKHGLTGQFFVLEYEDQNLFDNFLKQLIEDEKPVGAAELQRVVKMAQHNWLSSRALRMQEACFSMEPTTSQQKRNGEQAIGIRHDLDNYLRYHSAHDRAYRRASQELIQRRKERQIAERGFVSQKHAEAEETRKAEKHAQAMAIGKARLQMTEIRAAKAFADILPPDFAFDGPPPPLPDSYAASLQLTRP
jgi:hypothetical protein